MSRQTGATTEQMRSAAAGAYYVWCNSALDYPKDLARKLKREDLRIVSPWWLETGYQGLELKGLVVDHACRLTEQQEAGLRHAIARVRRANDADHR